MRLLDCCKIDNQSVSKYEGTKKYIATGDIINNKIVTYEEYYYDSKPSRANLQIEEGTVIFAKMKDTIKVLIGDKDNKTNTYSTGFCSLIPNDNILSKYLFYYLNSENFNNQKNKYSSGATQQAINNEKLKKIMIKEVPPLEKQKEIINKLDTIMSLIEYKKRQIDKLNELIKSQFVEMFGDIENTKYKIYELSKLANLITDGEHRKPNYTVTGIPFISVVNITTGELNFENCKFVSEADACKFNKRCNPEKGDILYTKVGATYGRSAIVDTNKKFALYVSVCLIKPKKDLINSTFLNYTMRQPYVKLQADKTIKGIGVPDLHLIEIKNFKIILPPIDLQTKFAQIVEQIDKQKFEFENSLKKLEELKKSLMQEYFG